MKYTKFRSRTYNSGMTLVELLVVLAIFMIVAGLTIFDYGSFRSTISTQNLVDDIALAVRKAQSYAIGARATGADFSNGYGVHFTTRKASTVTTGGIRGRSIVDLSGGREDPLGRALSTISGSNKSFILFTDIGDRANGIPGDRMYTYDPSDTDECGTDVSAGNECTEVFTITTLDEISAIYLNDDVRPISDDAFVDVTFLRPNPDAYFCYKATLSSNPPCDRSTDISHVRIEVSNVQNKDQPNSIKEVTIWNSGQISITTQSRTGLTPGDQGGVDTGPIIIDTGTDTFPADTGTQTQIPIDTGDTLDTSPTRR